MTDRIGRLAGKTAFITGAANGIGRAAATLFATEGAVVAVADVADDLGNEVVDQIKATGGLAYFFHVDVTEEAEVGAALDETFRLSGRLDVLYNNAGGSTLDDGPVTDVPMAEFWRAINLDLFGTWLCSRLAIPHMINSAGGSVINTSSVVVSRAPQGRAAYTAAKGAVAALTRAMAVDHAANNVRVNSIAPGTTGTDRVRRMMAASELVRATVATRQRLGLVTPDQIASAALYLASDESRTMTGQSILIDSGSSA